MNFHALFALRALNIARIFSSSFLHPSSIFTSSYHSSVFSIDDHVMIIHCANLSLFFNQSDLFYHQYFCMPYGGIGTWFPGYVAGSISLDWQGLPSLTSTGTATRLGEHPLLPASTRSLAALFVLYLWFWNQIFTWVGVRRMMEARCSRSGALR